MTGFYPKQVRDGQHRDFEWPTCNFFNPYIGTSMASHAVVDKWAGIEESSSLRLQASTNVAAMANSMTMRDCGLVDGRWWFDRLKWLCMSNIVHLCTLLWGLRLCHSSLYMNTAKFTAGVLTSCLVCFTGLANDVAGWCVARSPAVDLRCLPRETPHCHHGGHVYRCS